MVPPKRVLMVLSCFCLTLFAASAEGMDSDLGFYLDLPEGYTMSQQIDQGRFQFMDPTGRAYFQLVAYSPGTYPSAAAAMRDVASRLGTVAQANAYKYEGRDACLSPIRFVLGQSRTKGYALTVNSPDTAKGSHDFVILSTCEESDFKDYEPFLLSALDSFAVDVAALRDPGPVSQSACPFASAELEAAQIDFSVPGANTAAAPSYNSAAPSGTSAAPSGTSAAPSGTSAAPSGTSAAPLLINVMVGKGWAAVSQGVAQREFQVYSSYPSAGASDELINAAWARFYRVMYRDSYRRLDSMAFALGERVELDWAASQKSPNVSARSLAPKEEYVRRALTWVQSFKYERDLQGVDFFNPLSSALNRNGDCDSRSLLLAILLQHWNIDACMMISRVHSHAMALIDLPGAKGRNAGIRVNGKPYLAAETTVMYSDAEKKVPLVAGQLAEDMAHVEDWIPVALPY
jgi:hypothetical protein